MANHAVFTDYFVKIGQRINEMKLFTDHRWGRYECSRLIREHLKTAIKANRKWIAFNEQTGNYELLKIGAEAPKNWVGYNPNNTQPSHQRQKVKNDGLIDEVELID